MLNLFLLVVLQTYEEFSSKTENPVERYNDMVNTFKKAWNKYSTLSDEGFRILEKNATKFLMELEGELSENFQQGKDKNSKLDNIKKYLMEINIFTLLTN